MTRTTQTAVKMLESIPEEAQEEVVEHLRELVEDVRDELEWERLFSKKNKILIKTAHLVRRQIAAGKSSPMDYTKL